VIWTALDTMEFWDPATGAVTPAGKMTVTRDRPRLHLMADGKVLILGGAENDPAKPKLDSIELYDPETMTSAPYGKMSVGRMAVSILPYRNEGLLIAGGWVDRPDDGKAIEFLDFATRTSTVIGQATSSRAENAMLWLDESHFLLVGGKDNFGSKDPHSYHFDATEVVEVSP